VKRRLGDWCEMAVGLGVTELSGVVGYLLDCNDMSTEAEESSLLRSITGKRLVKAD
jgi:hypothetical protein